MTASPLLAAVVGWPIAHSRSPRLHGHWLARYGIAGFYIPIGLPPDAFADGVRALQALGFRGANVTIPHKEAALDLATEATPLARSIGAANTLTFGPDGAIHADNTDGYGFIANLRQQVPAWSASAGPALVLGAGGSARAVVAALLAEGAPLVQVAGRTRSRAEALRRHFGPRLAVLDWTEAAPAAAAAATIVNATPVGMADSGDLPISLEAAAPGTVVTDLVYGASPTPFILEARRLGLQGVDGLGMLLHQGAPGFERWFGVRPEVDEALRLAVLGS